MNFYLPWSDAGQAYSHINSKIAKYNVYGHYNCRQSWQPAQPLVFDLGDPWKIQRVSFLTATYQLQ